MGGAIAPPAPPPPGYATDYSKEKKRIVYPNLQSAMRPINHSKELPVPKPPNQEMSSSSVDECSSGESVQLSD